VLRPKKDSTSPEVSLKHQREFSEATEKRGFFFFLFSKAKKETKSAFKIF
jgi:hypothetical protein